jgi:hypothetical protein
MFNTSVSQKTDKSLLTYIYMFSDIAPVQTVVCMYFEKTSLVFKCCILHKIIVTYIKSFVSCINEFFVTRKIKSGQFGKYPPDGWRDATILVKLISYPR